MTRERIERRLMGWLRQGMSPQRLAVTLALGFTIGCVPVVGVPTVLCVGLALALGLNLPAIQAANYAAMPFQLALIVPFLKLGTRVLAFGVRPAVGAATLVNSPALRAAEHVGGMAGEAILGWLLVAVPVGALMTAGLAAMLKRVTCRIGLNPDT